MSIDAEVDLSRINIEAVGIGGPRGQQGAQGLTGETGPAGPANVLTIGTVQTGETAAATITGDSPNQVLDLILPKGDKGDTGDKGDKGDTGPQGAKGDKGEAGEKGDKGDTGPAGTTNYTDMTNKPSINNVTLTGSMTSEDLGLQPAGDYATTGQIPTKTSDLTNDCGFITKTVDDLTNYYDKDTVDDKVGEKADISDIPTKTSQLTNDSGFINRSVDNLTNYYNEDETNELLSHKADKNELPTKVSDLTNDSGFITNTVNNLVNYYKKAETYTKDEVSELLEDKADKTDIPTKTSQLTNDSGFITNTVSNLVNYYTKSQTYTKNEVNTLIGQIQTAHFEIVAELPVTGEDNVIYLVPRSESEEDNVYDEYIYVNNTWEKIGSTDIDLTGYATEDWVNLQIADFLTSAEVTNLINTALADYYTKTQIDGQIAQIEAEQTAQDRESDYFKTIYNALPQLTGTGADATIEDTANTMLKMVLKGNLSQDGTPTTEAPVDIDVVTGNNQIIVQNKNLLNLPSTYSIKGSWLYNLSLKSGAYTFSWSNWASSGANSQFSIDFIYTDNTSVNLYFYPAIQSYRNVTLEKDLKQIRIYSNTTEGNSRSITATFTNFMLEHGTYTSGFSYVPYNATTYPINIGNMEMCNIPNEAYSDDFREINGKWYKHAEVGKIASYDGETITTPYISTTGGLDTGATVYYGLATPIDEEITDTTLIGQLNIIKYALAYKGQTNISQVNSEQPFIINYNTLYDMQKLVDRVATLEA